MKPIVTDTYDFPTLIRRGYVYVDKTSVFAMVPHEWKIRNEAEAKRYFLLFMKLTGADIVPEFESAQGRADAVLQTNSTICIFEFKYGKSTKTALCQIAEKGYAKPYAGDPRRIVPIGVNYNPKTAEIEVLTGSICGPVNRGGGPVNCAGGPVMLLGVIRCNPGLRKGELSRISGITERSIKRYLTLMKDKVEFRGAPKTGGYYSKNT